MSDERAGVTVTLNGRIEKFAAGADPTKDKPFEVVEAQEVLVGAEAQKFLDDNKITVNTK